MIDLQKNVQYNIEDHKYNKKVSENIIINQPAITIDNRHQKSKNKT